VTKYGTDKQTTDGNIIWRIFFACRMTDSIGTHSEYSTLSAFPHQQWLRERALMLLLHYLCSFFFTLSIVYNFKTLQKTSFRKPALLPSSGKNPLNLADPLDRAILSQWAPDGRWTKSKKKGILCQ